MRSFRRFEAPRGDTSGRGATQPGPPLSGILLIDKPTGLTSAEVVRQIKALVRPQRVGHVGTLDPLASGLLPVVIGEATKLAPFLEIADKEYHGIIQLGVETDTLDSEGRVTARAPLPILDSQTLAEVEGIFSGTITQTVPIFSAVKCAGQPLYKLARKQCSVVPPVRTVTIKSLHLERVAEDRLAFVLVCSKGTYARALARDIGRKLGSAAFLAQLRRTRSGGFSLEHSCSLSDALAWLKHRSNARDYADRSLLVQMREALTGMEELPVDAIAAQRLRNGDASALDPYQPRDSAQPRMVKVLFGQDLVAIAEVRWGRARLLRVFRPTAGDLYCNGDV
jgi:tRNA pseudouridine55 synthase